MTPFRLVTLTTIVLAKVTVVIEVPARDGNPVVESSEVGIPNQSVNEARRTTHLPANTRGTPRTKPHRGCLRYKRRQSLRLPLSNGSRHIERRVWRCRRKGSSSRV